MSENECCDDDICAYGEVAEQYRHVGCVCSPVSSASTLQ